MFEKLKNLIKNNKGFLIKTTILLGMYFFLSDFAFAQNAGGVTEAQEEIKSKIIAVLVTLSTTLSVFLGLLTYLVTMFLSPEWITGNIFNMTDNLKSIWILISNVVYFSFAFILIYIAFMNIVGAGGNDYEFKTALPKFIVGILIVPFSWFLVNFMVTLSSILTMAALNLPFDTFKNYKSGIEKVSIPKECTIDLNALSSEGTTKQSGDSATKENNKTTTVNEIFSCEGNENLSNVLGTDNAAQNIFGMISLYTYGLVEIESNFKLSKETMDSRIKAIGDALVKVIFDMIFVIAYSLLMVALGLALMIRGIWLWIYMMLSPLFGLMYFFGKGKDGFFKNFNFTEFLHLCMVPVYTMLALSFGMLFIYQTGTGLTQKDTTSSNNGDKVISVKDNKDTGISSIVINNQFTLNVKGPIAEGTGKEEFQEGMKLLRQIGDTALGTVGALILKLFGIVVLWGTVMMALSRSEITKAMVEPIAKFGESVGDMARTIPQYTPILPGGQSLNTLQRVPNTITQNMKDIDMERGSKFIDDLGLGNALTNATNQFEKAANTFTTDQNKKQYFDNIMNIIKNNSELLKHDSFRNEIEKGLEKIGFDKIDLKGKNLEQLTQDLSSLKTNDKSLLNTLQISGTKKDYERLLGLSAVGAGEKVSDKLNGETGSNITINLANKSINLGNDKTINFSDNAKDVNTISSEIKTGLGNSTISKTDLEKALKDVGIIDNETINSIITKLGDKVTE